MENFKSRFSTRKNQQQQHQQQQQPNDTEQQHNGQKPQQQQSTEDFGQQKRESFYAKMMPNVGNLKNGIFSGKDNIEEEIKLRNIKPSIGNLDKYHTRNIYANRYKETNKRYVFFFYFYTLTVLSLLC